MTHDKFQSNELSDKYPDRFAKFQSCARTFLLPRSRALRCTAVLSFKSTQIIEEFFNRLTIRNTSNSRSFLVRRVARRIWSYRNDKLPTFRAISQLLITIFVNRVLFVLCSSFESVANRPARTPPRKLGYSRNQV